MTAGLTAILVEFALLVIDFAAPNSFGCFSARSVMISAYKVWLGYLARSGFLIFYLLAVLVTFVVISELRLPLIYCDANLRLSLASSFSVSWALLKFSRSPFCFNCLEGLVLVAELHKFIIVSSLRYCLEWSIAGNGFKAFCRSLKNRGNDACAVWIAPFSGIGSRVS